MAIIGYIWGERMDKTLAKKTGKQDRERKVLFGLIEFYLKTGKPVGSNTLKEAGFEDLSSATIRNYFANLEEAGLLTQQHSSGGRLPTHTAFKLYAQHYLDFPLISPKEENDLKLLQAETKQIAAYLQNGAELLSNLSQCAVFLSAPKFDQDFITDIKLIPIDHQRCLCILITDFGVIQTEVLSVEKKLSAFSAKRIEGYFHWRLQGLEKPENLEPEEESLAQKFYNEAMLRYIVGYTNFSGEEIYKTGFSKLLAYPEFHDPHVLSHSLSLFENLHAMRLLLKESAKKDCMKVWIGDDLSSYTLETPDCAVIATPYYINQQPVGAIGLLGPVRMPYRHLYGLLKRSAEIISEGLTRNIYKFKITLRQPKQKTLSKHTDDNNLIGHSNFLLLEHKR